MRSAYDAPNGAGNLALESAPASRPFTVLVADDDQEMLDAIAGVLLAQGCRVITAVDGHDALEKALQVRPDLVITDLLMPLIDGIGLAKALRADALTASARIVLCSGVSENSVRPLFSAYDGFLQKPYELDDLHQVLGKVRVR